MKKYNILLMLAISFLTCMTLNAQEISYPNTRDSSIIQIKDYYKGYGKVFKGNAEANRDFFGNPYPNYFVTGYSKDMALDEKDILKAEAILFKNYKDVSSKAKYYKVKNPCRHLKHYYRQYIGYFDENNQRMVLVHLMNFKKKNAKQSFIGWDKFFSLGFGDYYYENQETFLINLSKEEMRQYQ